MQFTVQIGKVGSQGAAAGGGNQLHFIMDASERAKVFKFVQGSGKALK